MCQGSYFVLVLEIEDNTATNIESIATSENKYCSLMNMLFVMGVSGQLLRLYIWL